MGALPPAKRKRKAVELKEEKIEEEQQVEETKIKEETKEVNVKDGTFTYSEAVQSQEAARRFILAN